MQGTTPVDIGSWRDVVVLCHVPVARNHDDGANFIQPANMNVALVAWGIHIEVPNANDVAHGRVLMSMAGEPWNAMDLEVLTQDLPTGGMAVSMGVAQEPGTRYRAQAECSRAGAVVYARMAMISSEPPSGIVRMSA